MLNVCYQMPNKYKLYLAFGTCYSYRFSSSHNFVISGLGFQFRFYYECPINQSILFNIDINEKIKRWSVHLTTNAFSFMCIYREISSTFFFFIIISLRICGHDKTKKKKLYLTEHSVNNKFGSEYYNSYKLIWLVIFILSNYFSSKLCEWKEK